MWRERPAAAEDYATFVTFQAHLGIEDGAPPEDIWREELWPYAFFLVEDDAIVGYAMCRAYRGRGDVRQVVVAPNARRRGVGRALLEGCAARLRAAGCREWRLEVRSDNVAAIALYRSFGMGCVRRGVTFRARDLDRLLAGEVAEGVVRPGGLADDEALERDFDLPVGKLARQRRVWPAGRLCLLEAEGAPAAFATYLPDFQPELALVFPLRAATAAAARSVLRAALQGDRPAQVELYAVDADLVSWLRTVAQTHEEVDEMAGPL